MGMTIAEKIIAAHAGCERVYPGQFVMVNTDVALANDITAPLAIQEFQRVPRAGVYDRRAIVFVLDHFVPSRDIRSAENCRTIRDFARSFDIPHLYEGGCGGIEHVIIPQKGIVTAGDIVVGADSHTCTCGGLGALGIGAGSTDLAFAMLSGKAWIRVPETIRVTFSGKRRPWVHGKDLILRVMADYKPDAFNYCVLEFSGDAIRELSMENRFTLCNMTIEAGAKSGIIEPDDTTARYLQGRSLRPPVTCASDAGSHYYRSIEYDCSTLDPLVALPPSPRNGVSVYELDRVDIDQVVIGGCTNGWLCDLEIAAQVVRGKKTHPRVRFLVIPGSHEIMKQAANKGLISTLAEAGAVLCPPTCGPCLGGHLGVLAGGERCLSTTNRNFTGRMGHPASEVYLSNPAIAAASAILGHIGPPDELGLPGGPP